MMKAADVKPGDVLESDDRFVPQHILIVAIDDRGPMRRLYWMRVWAPGWSDSTALTLHGPWSVGGQISWRVKTSA